MTDDVFCTFQKIRFTLVYLPTNSATKGLRRWHLVVHAKSCFFELYSDTPCNVDHLCYWYTFLLSCSGIAKIRCFSATRGNLACPSLLHPTACCEFSRKRHGLKEPLRRCFKTLMTHWPTSDKQSLPLKRILNTLSSHCDPSQISGQQIEKGL